MPRLCPSAPCEEGAYLIGRVQEDGTVAIIRSPIAIGETFVEQARLNGDPEANFRFAAPCVQDSCLHWAGRCSVADRVVAMVSGSLDASLPVCGIRAECRWYNQDGPPVCFGCQKMTRQPLQAFPDCWESE